MNSIFENAYFGKPYKTRDGRKAIYKYRFTNSTKTTYNCVIKEFEKDLEYTLDGKSLYSSNLDIISEWHGEINEEELSRLASEYAENDNTLHPGCAAFCAYKAGFRKALEIIKNESQN